MGARLAAFMIAAVFSMGLIACSDGPDNPAPTATAPAGTIEAPTRPPAVTTVPATATPVPVPPCPVELAICTFALGLLPLLDAGDADALLRLAEPVEATCPSAGLGGPSPSLCAGASTGEKRSGYWDVQAGEGLIVPEADVRRTLDRWFTSIEAATGNDGWGPGELRIGAIACSRALGAAKGQCDGQQVDVIFTFINSPDTPFERGTGLPGQRTTFFVRASGSGDLKVNGFGTTVPPNAFLDSLVLSAVGNDGRPYTLESYPWKP
jgi:hypothetical protein